MKLNKERKTERLLMLSDSDLSIRLGFDNFVLIRNYNPDIFDITDALRNKADAVGVFGGKKEVSYYVNRYAPGTIVYDADELIRLVYGEEEGYRENKTSIVQFCHCNRYLILGIFLFVLSYLMRSKIYFRLLSFLCIIIAAVSGIFRKRKGLKNFLIFLDKTGE